MELTFLLLAALSAAAGVFLRRRATRAVGRTALGFGLTTVAMALLVLALPFLDLWPFDTIAAGLAAVTFLAIAGLTLPFGIALSWRRRSDAHGPTVR